jgi:hypothetical protein
MTTKDRIYVAVTSNDIKMATKIGVERHELVIQKGLKSPDGRKPNFNVDREFHIRGAKGELAGRIFLGPKTHWNRDPATMFEADLAGFIDVKTVINAKHRLMVPTYSFWPNRAYLSVFLWKENVWEIRGWLWGREIKNVEEPQRGRKARVVRNSALRHPDELLKETNKRAAA